MKFELKYRHFVCFPNKRLSGHKIKIVVCIFAYFLVLTPSDTTFFPFLCLLVVVVAELEGSL